MSERPRIVGVVGGSGAGKTSLVAAVCARLGGPVAVLSQDSFYRDLSHVEPEARGRTNFDEPGALELDLLADCLEALGRGRTVTPPRYDMRTHTRTGVAAPVAPAGVVLVEGTLILAEPRILRAIDLLVYVDLPDDERLARRLDRDVRERGRTEDSVRARWRTTVMPMHRIHVAPARERANLVVSGDEPPDVELNYSNGLALNGMQGKKAEPLHHHRVTTQHDGKQTRGLIRPL